jgi:sortase A
MARERRPADELSIEELEALLARKKMEARQARLRQFKRSGRALDLQQKPPSTQLEQGLRASRLEKEAENGVRADASRRTKSGFNRVLLAVEVTAVVGLIFILFNGMEALQTLNQEVAQALSGATPSPTPLISAVVLPSGHTPPTSPGGARPNEAEIPENLRPMVQSMPEIPIVTPRPEQAHSIFIPAIWNTSAPVIQGDGWEQLKRGVGQYIGSADPGQAGNVVLSAHNDIFGELFRDLDKLAPGDEIQLQTASRQFMYRVTGIRVVEPTEVSVMGPTIRPTLTLISCYPYLVDTERIVVTAELAGG